MGNTHDNGEEKTYEAFLKRFEIIKKFNDPKFGECTILQDKQTHEQCVMREINSTDEEDFQQNNKKYEKRQNLNNPNIVQLLKYFIQEDSTLCSTVYKNILVFEFVNNSLDKETQIRKRNINYYSEPEAWDLLKESVNGLSYFQHNGIQHQNLKLSTLYLGSLGQVKVSDPVLFQQINNYALILTNTGPESKGIYLCPYQMRALFEKNWSPNYVNPYKSDVFVLGICMLGVSLLKNCDSLYDYENSIFDQNLLKKLLEELSHKYSNYYTQIIKMMLEVDDNNRPDFEQLQLLVSNIHQQFLMQGKKINQFSQQLLTQQINSNSQPKLDTQSFRQQQQQQQQPQFQFIPETHLPQQQSQYQQQSYSPSQAAQLMSQQDYSSHSGPYNEIKQENQLYYTEEKIYSLNALELVRDVEDQVFTSYQIPNDKLRVQLAKPDENIGNEIGMGQSSVEERVQGEQGVNGGGYEFNYRSTDNQANFSSNQQQQLNHNNNNPPSNNYSDNYYPTTTNEYKKSGYFNDTSLPQQQQEKQANQNQYLDNYSSTKGTYQNDYSNFKNDYTSSYKNNQNEQYLKQSVSSTNYSPLLQVEYDQKYTNYQPSSNLNPIQQNSTRIVENHQYEIKQADPYKKEDTKSKYFGANDIESILKKYEQPLENNNNKQQSYQQSFPLSSYNNVSNYQNDEKSSFKQVYPLINQQDFKLDQQKTQNQGLPQSTICYQEKTTQIYHNNQNDYSKINPTNDNYSMQGYQIEQKKSFQDSQNKFDNFTNQSSIPSYQIPQIQNQIVVENYQNGSKYEGEKKNGMRHGKGKFYYQDGGLYDGQWVENKMHGKGVLYYASGKPAYDGDWKEDKFEGFGVLYNEYPTESNQYFDYTDFDIVEDLWTKYDGEFRDDNKEGYGTLYLSNGEKFSGLFQNDFVSGKGTYFRINGQTVHGTWSNNKLVSQN